MKPSLLGELKRRNVFRAGAVYLAAAWLLMQIVTQLFPVFDFPPWWSRWIVVALILGFPLWITIAWLYELTPEGLKRESEIDPADSIAFHTGKKLDRWIIGILAVAVVLLLTNTFVWHKGAGLQDQAGEVAPPNSIAVLPFANLSADKSQGYFAQGISEDLLNLLVKVRPLRVAARTSSFAFQGKNLGVDEIARRLHVANVLEGSVRKAGDEVRITAQLVRASNGYEIWSQSYDRKLTDIFAIQDSIASDVVKNLKVKLLGSAPKARKTDPKVYALFLQGRDLERQDTREAFESSNKLFRQALAIDPKYAPAWVELARNALNQARYGMESGQQAIHDARDAAQRAFAIDSSYAPALAILGGIAMNRGNLAEAATYLHRALKLAPTNTYVLRDSSGLLSALDRLPQAIKVNEYLVARDPLNITGKTDLGYQYFLVGRFDDALKQLRTVLTLNPRYGTAHLLAGTALLLKGEPTSALPQMQRETSPLWRQFGLILAYHALGDDTKSQAALAGLIKRYGAAQSVPVAMAYAYFNNADKAFEWLYKAAKNNDHFLAGVPDQILLDNLHSDPRWLPFLRSIGKAPDQLAKIRFEVKLPQSAVQQQSTGGKPGTGQDR